MKTYKILNLSSAHELVIYDALQLERAFLNKNFNAVIEYADRTLPESQKLSEYRILRIANWCSDTVKDELIWRDYEKSITSLDKIRGFEDYSQPDRDSYIAIERACENLSRFIVGQYRTVFINFWHDWDNGTVIDSMIKEFKQSKLSVNGSYGIYQQQVPETSKIAWDIYQVMRYERSWSEAEHKPEQRNEFFTKYMTVNYDSPMKTAKTDLIRVEIKD